MLIRTEGRSNPLAEISSIAGFWFFWGTIFGICGLATAQRVIDAVTVTHGASEHPSGVQLPTVSGVPPALLVPGSANPPAGRDLSGK